MASGRAQQAGYEHHLWHAQASMPAFLSIGARVMKDITISHRQPARLHEQAAS